MKKLSAYDHNYGNWNMSHQEMRGRIVAVVPARMASSRFPGKPLAPLLGIPMIQHVLRRMEGVLRLEDIYVATCDEEIRNVAEAYGVKAIMTSVSHERATDRVAEAAQHFTADIIVIVQGDEPMITPAMVKSAVEPLLKDNSIGCANLVHRIQSQADLIDPNTIKVVADLNNNALYFSRAPIPWTKRQDSTNLFKQVCIIPFRHDCLREFAQLPSTPLERAESIDMLRLLEHGRKVRLIETKVNTHAVDTPSDLELVEQMMKAESSLTSVVSTTTET